MSIFRALVSLPLVLAACSGGTGDADSGVAYEKPQVLPAVNPVCLNMMHIAAGTVVNQPILIQNNGRMPLDISGAMMINDTRGAFMIQGPDVPHVTELDFANFQLRYAPADPGWDAAAVRIMSNAENYPILDIYVVALAEPAGLDGGVYDPGPRPEIARDACK